jgi:hypothetical protein
MPLKFNFKDMKQGAYAPLDPGIHPVIVVKAEEGTSKAGNPILIVDFEVLDGPNKGGMARANMPDFRTFEFLKAVGYEEKEIMADDFEVIASDYVGLQLQIATSLRSDQGNTYTDIKKYIAAEQPAAVEEQETLF